jgi:hypothetical protein
VFCFVFVLGGFFETGPSYITQACLEFTVEQMISCFSLGLQMFTIMPSSQRFADPRFAGKFRRQMNMQTQETIMDLQWGRV